MLREMEGAAARAYLELSEWARSYVEHYGLAVDLPPQMWTNAGGGVNMCCPTDKKYGHRSQVGLAILANTTVLLVHLRSSISNTFHLANNSAGNSDETGL